MANIEIEIKVQIEKSAPLRELLQKSGKFVAKNRQVDHYFTPAHKDYMAATPVEEWLRLREEEGKPSITYKRWHHNEKGDSTYADEFETMVGSIEQMQHIFRVLDIRPLTTVDKTRETYLYQDYEIALDSVVGLGDFVEIEYKGKHEAEYQKIKEGMIAFLKTLKLGKMYRNLIGYPAQLLSGEPIRVEI